MYRLLHILGELDWPYVRFWTGLLTLLAMGVWKALELLVAIGKAVGEILPFSVQ